MTNLTSEELRRAADLKEQIEELQSQLTGVLAGRAVGNGQTATRRNMSAAGRARIAAAQRARWAKIKGASP